MQLQRYSAYTAPKQEKPYRFIKSSTQLSLPMLKNTTSKQDPEREGYREPFPTIDEALALSQRLQDTLKKLGEQKYPLDVRKGIFVKGVIDVGDIPENIQMKGSGRTYFFDFKEISEGRSKGKSFLRITESRMKSKDGKPERSSIIIFPEDAKEFAKAVAEAITKMTALNL